MRDFPGFFSLRLPLLAFLLVSSVACTSGGGGNGDSTSAGSSSSNTSTGCPTTVTLTGQVLAGAPVLNAAIVVKDVNAVTRAATGSSTDGSYSVNIGCLTAPIVVEASGIVAGRQVVEHSFLTGFSGSAPVLNVTPLSDAMLALVGGMDPTGYFSAQNFSLLGLPTTSTNSVNAALQAVLLPLTSAVGVGSPNFFTDTITTSGRSGLDEVLELINVVSTPLTTSNGAVTSEQVQIISRLDPTQRVQLTFSNASITASSSTTATGAVLGSSTVWTADLAGFTGAAGSTPSSLAGFGGIDGLITNLNSDISGNNTATPSEYLNYLNNGKTSAGGGSDASYSSPVIERCDASNNTCLVRLGYTWTNTSTSKVALNYYYDTLQDNGSNWSIYGNHENYPVDVGYRYLQPQFPPSFPDSALTPTPSVSAAQNPIEQLAVTVDTSQLPVVNGAVPSVQSVTVYTVNGSAAPQALALALTPALNSLRAATGYPVTLVLPLTQAEASQINAANGHIQVQTTLSSGASNTRPTVDRYLTWAMDPGTSALPNQTLAFLPYPALLNNSLSQFLTWNPNSGSFSIDTTNLSAPVTAASPSGVPLGDIMAVFGYNASAAVSNPPYMIGGQMNFITGVPFSNMTTFSTPQGLTVTSTADRKLVVGTEDKDLNHYVSAYCVGANVVSNCQ